jgi:hypothetical protein
VCIQKFLLTPRLDQEPNDIESSHRDISRRVGRSSWCAHHQPASRPTAFYYRAVERFFAWCDGRPRRRSHSRRGILHPTYAQKKQYQISGLRLIASF